MNKRKRESMQNIRFTDTFGVISTEANKVSGAEKSRRTQPSAHRFPDCARRTLAPLEMTVRKNVVDYRLTYITAERADYLIFEVVGTCARIPVFNSSFPRSFLKSETACSMTPFKNG